MTPLRRDRCRGPCRKLCDGLAYILRPGPLRADTTFDQHGIAKLMRSVMICRELGVDAAEHRLVEEGAEQGVVAGAVLLEQNDEWLLQCRTMQIEGMAELTSPLLDADPVKLPPLAA